MLHSGHVGTAARIRARAVRRAGELARQVMQPAQRPQKNVEGNLKVMSRDQVKEASGFSDHQLTQATRIANVPEQTKRVSHIAVRTPLTVFIVQIPFPSMRKGP